MASVSVWDYKYAFSSRTTRCSFIKTIIMCTSKRISRAVLSHNISLGQKLQNGFLLFVSGQVQLTLIIQILHATLPDKTITKYGSQKQNLWFNIPSVISM